MKYKEIIEKYIRNLVGQFKCIPTPENRLRIITPYLYPNNDFIEIFIEDLGNGYVKVTDLGESSRYLHSQGFDVEISNEKLTKVVPIDKILEAMSDIITVIQEIVNLIYRREET